MIQLRTILMPADNAGAKRLRVIHIFGADRRRFAHIGDIVNAIVDQADPQGVVKDSEMVRVLIVRTRKELRRSDGSYIRFDDNAVVLVDKKEPRATRIFGPVPREIKEKGYDTIISLAEELV